MQTPIQIWTSNIHPYESNLENDSSVDHEI